MNLYTGLDLHSSNAYIRVLDPQFNRIFNKRVSNDLDLILETSSPKRKFKR
jgi:hypothetical protein